MFARIGTFHSAPEQVDDDVARHAREQMLSRLRELPGFIGLHVFAFLVWDIAMAALFWRGAPGSAPVSASS